MSLGEQDKEWILEAFQSASEDPCLPEDFATFKDPALRGLFAIYGILMSQNEDNHDQVVAFMDGLFGAQEAERFIAFKKSFQRVPLTSFVTVPHYS